MKKSLPGLFHRVGALKLATAPPTATQAALLEGLEHGLKRISLGEQLEPLKLLSGALEKHGLRLSRDQALEIKALGATLAPALASAFGRKQTGPAPEAEYRLRALVLPQADDLARLWPVLGSALAMGLLHLMRQLGASDPEDLLRWGGFQKAAVRNGQWWRVATHAFVHHGWLHALSDIAGVVVFGTGLARLHSPALAFSAFRLGIFAGLLSVVLELDEEETVASLSSAPTCMLGALLATALLKRRQLSGPATGDGPAALVLLLTGLSLLVRPLTSAHVRPRAQLVALLAGVGAAGLAALVDRLEPHAVLPSSLKEPAL